jgi:hypothetical protein
MKRVRLNPAMVNTPIDRSVTLNGRDSRSLREEFPETTDIWARHTEGYSTLIRCEMGKLPRLADFEGDLPHLLAFIQAFMCGASLG